MDCHSLDRASEARNGIRSKGGDGSLSVRELDLADLDSIRSLGEQFSTEHSTVDVVCNNAGVLAIPSQETADVFEIQFGANHFGHFALAVALLEHLELTPGKSRVATQSSGPQEGGGDRRPGPACEERLRQTGRLRPVEASQRPVRV